MLCPECEVWEISAADNYCSWCRHSLLPHGTEAPQPTAPVPLTAPPVARAEPAVANFAATRTAPPPSSFPAAPQIAPAPPPPQPPASWLAPSQPLSRPEPITAPQQPSPAPPPPYRPVVLPPKKKRSFANRILHFIGSAILLITIVVAAVVLGVVLLVRSLFPPEPPRPPSISSQPEVIRRGQTALLRWSAEGLKNVQINGQPVRPQASRVVSPAASTSYELTAETPTGKIESAETRLVVIQPARPIRKPDPHATRRRPPPSYPANRF